MSLCCDASRSGELTEELLKSALTGPRAVLRAGHVTHPGNSEAVPCQDSSEHLLNNTKVKPFSAECYCVRLSFNSFHLSWS